MSKPTPPPAGPPPNHKTERQEGTILKERLDRPRKFKVLLHNDDYTPMEFVVFVLETIFRKSKAESTRIMLTVHNEGAGVAGIYPREIAETKATEGIQAARQQGYPLLLTTEPE